MNDSKKKRLSFKSQSYFHRRVSFYQFSFMRIEPKQEKGSLFLILMIIMAWNQQFLS